MIFQKLNKLKRGDKVAIISPSFAAPAIWPEVYQLGLDRLQNQFGLIPVEYPTTARLNATKEDRMTDIIKAFVDPEIKGVIATLGGSDQVTYIKNLAREVFINNPKPFYGFSDNSHLSNFLWLNGIPSFYGGSLFGQFAMPEKIDSFTAKYLELGLFSEKQEFLTSSSVHCEYSRTDWGDFETMSEEREFIPNKTGWLWDGEIDTSEIAWGGCLESIDEMLRHGVLIPSREEFENIVLVLETSEEIPSHDYVSRVIRALGERNLLEKIGGVLVGRPDTGAMDKTRSHEWRKEYRKGQAQTIIEQIRNYNKTCPIIQNMDFGHTHSQICLPLGQMVEIKSSDRTIKIQF